MATGPGTPKPDCDCHGEPMLWHKDRKMIPGGWWQCRVTEQARNRRRYAEASGLAYNRLLLMHRRNKAMDRRRKREAA